MKNTFLLLFLSAILGDVQAQNFEWADLSDFGIGDFFTVDNDGNIVNFNNSMDCTDTCFTEFSNPASFILDTFSNQNCRPSFMKKVDVDGDLVWVKQITDSCALNIDALDTDNENNIYLFGNFKEVKTFMPNQTGETLLNSNGSFDLFLAKFDPQGELLWHHTFGGIGSDWGLGLKVEDEFLYITGEFREDVDFDLGSGTEVLSETGGINTFIAKYDLDANLIWAKGLEGGLNRGRDIDVDHFGNVYISGKWRNTTDFDPDPSVQENETSFANNREDGYILKLDSLGDYLWHIGLQENAGSVFEDHRITLDHCGSIYYCGIFQYNLTINVNPNGTPHIIHKPDTATTPIRTDYYLAKFNTNGINEWAYPFGGPLADKAYDVTVDTENNVYFSTVFTGTIDADPSANVVEHVAASNNNDALIQAFDESGNYLFSWEFESPTVDAIHNVKWKKDRLIFPVIANSDIDLDVSNNVFNPILEAYPNNSGGFLVSYSVVSPKDTIEINACIEDTLVYANQNFINDTLFSSKMLTNESCDSMFFVKIEFNISLPIALFDFSIDQGEVQFNNLSTNADSSFWNIGIGDSSSIENPQMSLPVGEHIISLTAFNTSCIGSSQYTDTLWIEEPIGINEALELEMLISPNPNNGTFLLQINTKGKNQDVEISIFNSLGQKLSSKQLQIDTNQQDVLFDLEHLSSGVYQLRFFFDSNIKTYPLLVK